MSTTWRRKVRDAVSDNHPDAQRLWREMQIRAAADKKLDLTVNFVGELSSVNCLKQNIYLKEMYLVGNPCAEFEGYRPYVVATLPQLKWLDGKEIERSERIQAMQDYSQVILKIKEQEDSYIQKRTTQKEEAQRCQQEKCVKEPHEKKPGFDRRWYTDINNTVPDPIEKRENPPQKNEVEKELREEEQEDKEFWQQPSLYTPESRLETHRYLEEKRKVKEDKSDELNKKPLRTLITTDGRVLNVNAPKLDFSLVEDEGNNQFILDLAIFRHLDSSLVEVDVQPSYIKVLVKDKPFQLVLPAEVKPDSSSAKRSQTTGHLVITMPKATEQIQKKRTSPQITKKQMCENSQTRSQTVEMLEVDPKAYSFPDIANIVQEERCLAQADKKKIPDIENYENIADNEDVPPLI
ncbi:hypothetical protein GDO86_010695 [Hymenochirus boettgeri]|uniref:CS domain-containing protein n=1 Tax=Hymenochirus boettgeri TaxID=247094 RepID=A0A8T2JDQ4_9PIPI|nr:hypothetical protein GDO86_010695 [Hymenochirus boettgeri]